MLRSLCLIKNLATFDFIALNPLELSKASSVLPTLRWASVDLHPVSLKGNIVISIVKGF